MPELILTLKNRELKRVSIVKTEMCIGRDPDDDLHIDNIGISRSHVKIRVTAQGDIFAMDNQSRNGTYINGEKIAGRHKLREGDNIQLAKYVVTFSPKTGERLDINKMRQTASQSGASEKSAAAQGTLSFSADEIQRLVKANPKQGLPTGEIPDDFSQLDPMERLFAEEKAKREALAAVEKKKQINLPNLNPVVLGLATIILLLLIIVLLLLRRG